MYRSRTDELTGNIDDSGANQVSLVADEDDGLVHARPRVPQVPQSLLRHLDRLQAVHAVEGGPTELNSGN